MKPYKFQPFLKTTIWGGYQIAPFKGIFNAQPNVGESWEISGVPGHESVAVKTEMWYVIKSDVGAKIYAGLSRSITPDDYERLATVRTSPSTA